MFVTCGVISDKSLYMFDRKRLTLSFSGSGGAQFDFVLKGVEDCSVPLKKYFKCKRLLNSLKAIFITLAGVGPGVGIKLRPFDRTCFCISQLDIAKIFDHVQFV